MKHSNIYASIIISIVTVTAITFLTADKQELFVNKSTATNYTTELASKFQGPKSTIRKELINTWLSETTLLNSKELELNHNNTASSEELTLVEIDNNIIVLDLPHTAPKNRLPLDKIVLTTPSYWEVVHSIESKQGKMLYRPRNKEKSCKNTNAPCGHYQISAQALKDIGCLTRQCKIDREDHDTSLEMSKTLEKINLNRLAKSGHTHLPDFQKYLIHQQGATGIRKILDAKAGKSTLSKRLTKNMANNSSYSYKQLTNQLAARSKSLTVASNS